MIKFFVNRELIEEKYLKMKQHGITVDFLDEQVFGGIKMTINLEMKEELFSIQIDEDIVRVGGR